MTRKRRNPSEPDSDLDEEVTDSNREPKERVLHARIPERLEAHLRERAEDLGISVSNLVRNVLDHAMGLVGDVVADSHAIARAARGDQRPAAPAAAPVNARMRPGAARNHPGAPAAEAPSVPAAAAAPPSSLDDVLAWQPAVLGKNAVCARCNDILPRGSDAAIGAGTSFVICSACLKGLR